MSAAAITPRRVIIVTGSRAEFGLLRPVMRAVHDDPNVELLVIAAGSHLVPPALTVREVQSEFPLFETVPMQIAGRAGRAEDAESASRGMALFSHAFERARPAWVVVLGDRIEAFAAAAAASIGGRALAHIHGGDRAEGIADEAMRRAISAMAHLHLAATRQSADRLVRSGEEAHRVHVVGSPAIDGLADMPPLSDHRFAALGKPGAVVLFHPTGRTDQDEGAAAAEVIRGALAGIGDAAVLVLAPNLDAGRGGIVHAIERLATSESRVRPVEHLPRAEFIGLLRRLASAGGVLVGNSSAGLIEAGALRVAAVDVGHRQRGRERAGNVVHTDAERAGDIADAIAGARALDLRSLDHPFGDGRAGERIAGLISRTDTRSPGFLRKICAY